ncbi:MAG: 1-deoxy-d-xylulose 5-phosphate reductoisomerase (dxpreductoisomerase) [Steroidobacteraceae bacterium]|nr:1-deoxy-d-xylulose 5-phosphate reductoisomerase (dxpreductoisomerase) [Steroidobacteraceae bacterium]MBM2853662.1 1-deoxy-d-xylulose 5-phosphate reductoisomerase (dxpreductoisomerase) [Steroidobacteraceae bacterium]
MRGLVVLGSTGSIGENTLDVAARHPDRFRIVALAARANDKTLAEQCLRFRPAIAAMLDGTAAARLTERLAAAGCDTRVLAGPEALLTVATLPEAELVMAAIVGAAGLAPTLAAAAAGKQLLLANKEALVLAGALLIDTARKSGARILPIDSEHNAVFQCLPPDRGRGGPPPGVTRIWLTASGGPFLKTRREDFASVTPEQAIAHPNWRMGRKISVDSATLMNKGLELIEACHLFGVGPDRVRIVIHPQSIVHSLVEFDDGSVLAQLSHPDMRVPIAHALGWPDRIASGVQSLDLVQVAQLSFEAPDLERFPCLGLAVKAARAGGTAPAVVNAANEVAVAAFLERSLNFDDIATVIDSVLQQHQVKPVRTLDDALAADSWARDRAGAELSTRLAAGA